MSYEPGAVCGPFGLTTQTVACIVAKGYRTGAHPVTDSEACRSSSSPDIIGRLS